MAWGRAANERQQIAYAKRLCGTVVCSMDALFLYIYGTADL